MENFCNTFFWKMAIKACSIEIFYKIWLSWKFPQFFLGGKFIYKFTVSEFFFYKNLLFWKMSKKLFSWKIFTKIGFVQKFSLKVALLESFKNNSPFAFAVFFLEPFPYCWTFSKRGGGVNLNPKVLDYFCSFIFLHSFKQYLGGLHFFQVLGSFQVV